MSMSGSKRRVIEKIWLYLPKPKTGTFIIPFFGTGVDSGFILNQGYDVFAGDSQRLLIDWHQNVEQCMKKARRWAEKNLSRDDENNKAAFLRLRTSYNKNPKAWKLWTLGRLSHSQLIRHN